MNAKSKFIARLSPDTALTALLLAARHALADSDVNDSICRATGLSVEQITNLNDDLRDLVPELDIDIDDDDDDEMTGIHGICGECQMNEVDEGNWMCAECAAKLLDDEEEEEEEDDDEDSKFAASDIGKFTIHDDTFHFVTCDDDEEPLIYDTLQAAEEEIDDWFCQQNDTQSFTIYEITGVDEQMSVKTIRRS